MVYSMIMYIKEIRKYYYNRGFASFSLTLWSNSTTQGFCLHCPYADLQIQKCCHDITGRSVLFCYGLLSCRLYVIKGLLILNNLSSISLCVILNIPGLLF